jgi:hypothetical protein
MAGDAALNPLEMAGSFRNVKDNDRHEPGSLRVVTGAGC